MRAGGDLSPPLLDLWIKGIRFHLYSMLHFTGLASVGLIRDEAAVERAIHFINAETEKGLLKPKIDRTFRLDEVAGAHRYMEEGSQIGKIVITV